LRALTSAASCASADGSGDGTGGAAEALGAAIKQAKAWYEANSWSVKQLGSLKQAKRRLKQLLQQRQQHKHGHEGGGEGNGGISGISGTKQGAVQQSAKRTIDMKKTTINNQTTMGEQSPAPPAVQMGSMLREGELTWHSGPGAVLGEGSMGTRVYRGRHEQWGELAVKVMHKAHVPEHRACREQELLLKLADEAGVGSNNVIKYRCRVDTVDTVMIGMELCECSLHQLITERRLRPTPKQQARISRELCEGVTFLHEHSIIHRDLRPKNILMKTAGLDGTVKVVKQCMCTCQQHPMPTHAPMHCHNLHA
jgi:hypothetical protein